MDFQYTPLARQLGVFAGEAVAVSYRLTAELITPLATHKVPLVTQMHTVRDFEKAVGDELYVDIKYGPYAYQKDILPYQQQLKIRIIIEAYSTLESKRTRVDSTPHAYVYRAVCLSTMDTVTGGNDERTASNGKNLDLESMRDIQFQLFDPVLESFMQTETGDNYTGCTVKNVLGVEFAKILQSVESDTGFKMRGVDIATPQNEEPVKMLAIPHGTQALDLVDKIQNQVGIYASDVGCYYQSPYLYIYPLYDTSRFESDAKVAVVYNYPSDKFPGFDKTWIDRQGSVEIAATRSGITIDLANLSTLVGGTGSRFTSASNVSTGMTMTKDGETVIGRSLNNSEFVTSERQDGVKVAKGTGRVTNNRWRELSRTAARKGRSMMVAWEHANIDLLYPAMPTKIVWIDENALREAKGVLMRAECSITMAGSTFKEPQWNCHGSLNFWLDAKENDVVRPLA